MTSIRICDDCKATNINTLVPRLKELGEDITIDIGCQGFCGIGQNKAFAIVNNMPVICQDEDELILKISGILKKE